MQTYHRVHVQLGKKDRKQIAGMLNKGRESARVLRRASILRQLDQGQTVAMLQSHDLKPWREKNVVRGGTG